MTKSNVTDRLSFLAEQFDVFENECLEDKIKHLNDDSLTTSLIVSNSGKVLGLLTIKVNNKNRQLKTVSVSSDVFSLMVSSDPTENKIYLQWMLNVFSRLVKDGSESSLMSAIRFVDEDLPQANVYLVLFENNKRKKKFIDLCGASYGLKHITDPTNINQYKSLSQLFDAVDPFIEKEPSAVERTMEKFVKSGQADIPVKDRKFTLFIPKTTAANVVFDKFTNWCTAKEGNGMFNSYTMNNKKPNGKNSDIYIIINNKFFEGKSDELYQIHFETGQLKDRKNGQNVSIFESVLSESDGISNYFKEELMTMAKQHRGSLDNNRYLDYLIKFGFTDSLFEMLDENTPIIRFMTREIPKLPDISRFVKTDQLIITDANLVELHPSIGMLSNLELISLTGNKIKSIPREIGNLKRLKFLNLTDNPIREIPNEISELDSSRGGSLFRLGIKREKVGEDIYNRLKELLPTTLIS